MAGTAKTAEKSVSEEVFLVVMSLFDAKDGLQGKDKPTYTPNKEEGDVVLVTNARHVEFTGRKWEQKVYRWHTG